MAADRVDAVVNLSKRRGFVFQSSEIYGGSRSAWDYGPLGVEFKNNIKRAWWKAMVQDRGDIVGIDQFYRDALEMVTNDSDFAWMITPITARVNATSYETSWAIARMPPSSAYFDADAQPPIISP